MIRKAKLQNRGWCRSHDKEIKVLLIVIYEDLFSLLMSILSKTLFTFVCRYFMTFSFLSARHDLIIYFFDLFIVMLLFGHLILSELRRWRSSALHAYTTSPHSLYLPFYHILQPGLMQLRYYRVVCQ